MVDYGLVVDHITTWWRFLALVWFCPVMVLGGSVMKGLILLWIVLD